MQTDTTSDLSSGLMPAIPGVRNAKLPAVYVEAQNALARCQSIDECKEWADKAAAIASYAKQAQDETLMDTAMRIKARAVQRCGELLKQIDRGAGRPTIRAGAGPNFRGRKGVAAAAGLSDRRRKDALRIASIPKAQFEAMVESDAPPTITALSEAGKQEAANRAYLHSPKPPGFKHATKLLGTLEDFAAFCSRADPILVAEALSKREAQRALRDTDTVSAWLKRLRKEIA